jgi:hypothetical protein
MTALARQRSKECRFCQSQLPFRHLATTPSNCCGGQRPFLLRKASRGRRPQRPGNQSRLRAFLMCPPGNSLSRITGCHWLCRNHPASSGTLTFR